MCDLPDDTSPLLLSAAKLTREPRQGEQEIKEEKGRSKQTRIRIVQSMVIFFCNFSFGIACNVLGPSLLAFSHKLGRDVGQISILFTIQTSSYLVGALTGGFVHSWLPRRQLGIIFYLSFIALALFILPNVTGLAAFFVSCGLLGFGGGGYHTGQVAWIIELWRGSAVVPILAQYFTYSLGTILPPFLLSYFLDESLIPGLGSTPQVKDLGLDTPYVIAGSIVTVGIIMQIFLLLLPDTDSNKANDEEKNESSSGSGSGSSSDLDLRPMTSNTKVSQRTLLFLSCIAIGSFQAMETTIFNFLPTFAVFAPLKPPLSQAEGANVLTQMTVAFAVARMLSVVIGAKVTPFFIIVSNFVLIIGANLILLGVGLGVGPGFGMSSGDLLKFGVILMGAGLSTVYPGYYAYIEKYLYVRASTAAVLTVSGGLWSALYPLVVGPLVKENPSVLIYITGFSSLIFLCVLFLVFWLVREPKD